MDQILNHKSHGERKLQVEILKKLNASQVTLHPIGKTPTCLKFLLLQKPRNLESYYMLQCY